MEPPAVETSAAESNALRKKHLMIHAKIAAPGDMPGQKQRGRKISFQEGYDLNTGSTQAQIKQTVGKIPQKAKVEFS